MTLKHHRECTSIAKTYGIILLNVYRDQVIVNIRCDVLEWCNGLDTI